MTNSKYPEPSEEEDRIASVIVPSAFKVHKTLGPGLLERYYRDALVYELRKQGLIVDKEAHFPVYYDGVCLEGSYKVDLLVEGKVIIELKTVEKLLPLHTAQIRTYLRISNCHLGLLINFNTPLIKDGLHRVILS